MNAYYKYYFLLQVPMGGKNLKNLKKTGNGSVNNGASSSKASAAPSTSKKDDSDDDIEVLREKFMDK